ncbi:TlpA disulfide reductase family protein [Nannocystaceae bacterium ST9]
MSTSRSILSLALVTLGLIGCKTPSSPPPKSEEVSTAITEPTPESEPAEREEAKQDDDGAADEAVRGGGSAEPKAAATDIITVADAGASSVGPDTAATDPEPIPEPDPDEKTAKDDERPPLPKPIFGDAAKASCRKQLEVGNKIKSFKLGSLDGKKTISSSAYRGRVMLVNFWATWCKPCIKELPDLDRLYRKYRNNGMTLVAIATDEEAAGVQAIVDDLKLAAKVAIGGEKAAADYDHPNFPFSFVVDGDGKIVAAYDKVDESCLADLESVLRDELEKLD